MQSLEVSQQLSPLAQSQIKYPNVIQQQQQQKEASLRDLYKFQIPNIKQFSRQGKLQKLLFYGAINSQKSVSPKNHLITLNDKQRRFENIPNIKAIKPSFQFKNISREQVYQQQKKEESGYNYEPNFNFLKQNPVKYTISPVSKHKGKIRIYSPPDCIHRGNQCEYKIRDQIKNLKIQSAQISECKEKLQSLEKFTNSFNGDDDSGIQDGDLSKKKQTENYLVDKRKLAEIMLENEKSFIKTRDQYDKIIKKNINQQEYNELNLIQEMKLPKIVQHISYDRLIGRKSQVFEQFMPKIPDKNERLYNNYRSFSPKQNRIIDFQVQRTRSPLFKESYSQQSILRAKEEFEKFHYDRSPYVCNVNYKKSLKKTVPLKLEQKDLYKKDLFHNFVHQMTNNK